MHDFIVTATGHEPCALPGHVVMGTVRAVALAAWFGVGLAVMAAWVVLVIVCCGRLPKKVLRYF